MAGCRERLQVKNIRRVTDSSGEAILAVEDLVHDDHIVIYATPTASDGAPALPSADDLGPTLPLPLQALSAAAVTKSRFLQSIDTPGGTNGSRAVSPPPPSPPAPAAASGSLSEKLEHLRLPSPKVRPSMPQLLEKLEAAGRSSSSSSSGGGGDGAAERDWTQAVLQASSDNRVDLSSETQVGSRQPIDGASYAAAAIALAHADASKSESGGSSHSLPRASDSNVHASASSTTAAASASDGVAGGDPLERDPLYDHENPSRPCGKRHPTFRLAMLIPWVNDLPPWLSYFAATAQRSEYLVGFRADAESPCQSPAAPLVPLRAIPTAHAPALVTPLS